MLIQLPLMSDSVQRNYTVLLAGLVKNRALSIVRAAPPGNGYEALRQLVLSMRPNTQARGLSLLASVTAVAVIPDEQALTSSAFEAGGCIRGD